MADDRSDPEVLAAALPAVAAGCDLLLGPYSTGLMRVAGRLAAERGWLLWNHGGAGDDVLAAYPGHLLSVLTPASQYAELFVQLLAAADSAAGDGPRVRLWIAHGTGSFGRQVAAGAEDAARRAGLTTARLDHATGRPPDDRAWDLLGAGSFDEDVGLIRRVRSGGRPPRVVGAVAAGVREFGVSGVDPEGVYGVGQWFPGVPGASAPAIGPGEGEFLAAYAARYGSVPDYPAIQAVAAAVLATHCLRTAGRRDPVNGHPGRASHPGSGDTGPGGAGPGGALWRAALGLDTSTLFGGFRVRAPDGRQEGHRPVLVRWTGGEPALVRPADGLRWGE